MLDAQSTSVKEKLATFANRARAAEEARDRAQEWILGEHGATYENYHKQNFEYLKNRNDPYSNAR